MTPEQLKKITHRARCDADAKRCGYPEPSVKYTGEEREIYEYLLEQARQAYRGRK